MKGHFIGIQHIDVIAPTHWWEREMYHIWLDPIDPLVWIEDGVAFKSEPCFNSDGGSEPHILAIVPVFSKWRFQNSYGQHDFRYSHHYMMVDRGSGFRKEICTKWESDRFLHDGVLAEDGCWLTADTIRGGVIIGGYLAWRKGNNPHQHQCKLHLAARVRRDTMARRIKSKETL